jgi:hypothetical protein
MKKNWKTTVAGILAIVAALAGAGKCAIDGGQIMNCLTESWPAIMIGIGLIFAKDNNVTGGTVQQ